MKGSEATNILDHCIDYIALIGDNRDIPSYATALYTAIHFKHGSSLAPRTEIGHRKGLPMGRKIQPLPRCIVGTFTCFHQHHKAVVSRLMPGKIAWHRTIYRVVTTSNRSLSFSSFMIFNLHSTPGCHGLVLAALGGLKHCCRPQLLRLRWPTGLLPAMEKWMKRRCGEPMAEVRWIHGR